MTDQPKDQDHPTGFVTQIRSLDGVQTLIVTLHTKRLDTMFASAMRMVRAKLKEELATPGVSTLIIALPDTICGDSTGIGCLAAIRASFIEAHQLSKGTIVHLSLRPDAVTLRRALHHTATTRVLVPLPATQGSRVHRSSREPATKK